MNRFFPGPRRYSRWLGGAFLFLLLLSVMSAYTARNTVNSTSVDADSVAVTANLLKPAECDGINLTRIVIAGNGTNASELILGTAGADTLYGGGGNDCIVGGEGGDALYGEGGNDIIMGNDGFDSLYGGDGNDRLYGGLPGWVFLFGDVCVGDAGDDLTYGCEWNFP